MAGPPFSEPFPVLLFLSLFESTKYADVPKTLKKTKEFRSNKKTKETETPKKRRTGF